MSARIGRIDFALVFGLGFGLYSFFKGLRIYREYRVIEDTPEMPVRSIAMGLVAVRGRAVGEPPVTSPISRTPCYFYKVEIEKWQSNSRSGGGTWHHYAAGTGGGEFYLEDATGKVLVDARQAELDLVCVEEREVDGTTGLFYSTMPVIASDSALDAALGSSDEHLLAYVSKIRGASGLAHGQFRLTEYCIEPEQWYDVTGTCAENPHPAGEHDRNLIKKGQNEPTFLISSKDKKGVESSLRWKAAGGVFGGAGFAIACLAGLLIRFGLLSVP